jgi:hypothetical protein
MQLTIGTSANFVLGRTFDMNLGPPQIQVRAGPGHMPTYVVCAILTAVTIAWVIAYGCIKDEQARVTLSILCQVTVDVLLMVMMIVEMNLQAANATLGKILQSDAVSKAIGDMEKSFDDIMELIHGADLFGVSPDGYKMSDYLEALGVIPAFLGIAIEAGAMGSKGFSQ